MRVIILCAVAFLSCGCLAQTNTTVADQTQSLDVAGSPISGPGLYSLPFTPLLATPTAKLSEPTLQVGASNATAGNVAGAETSTLSSLPQRVEPLAIAPRLSGAPISYDLYPRADSQEP